VLAVRTWLRYAVPLTLLAAIALAPIAWLALRVPAPADVNAARAQVRLAFVIASGAWMFQLWLVAAAAPCTRARLSQWRALTAGVAGLARGFVPWLIAIAAIALGTLALVVPGLVLLVLLSLTGASELSAPPPAPLAESIAAARAQLATVAALVAGMIALDLAIAFVAQAALVPAVANKAKAVQLLPIRTFVRVVALALVVVSPLPACGLAAIRSRTS